jgi:hypothetical protein
VSESQEVQGENQVTVHVRFAPDGSVAEIGARPAEATPQKWFNTLSANCAASFRALTGGRGIFVVAAEKLSALQTTVSKSAAGLVTDAPSR